MKRSPLIQRWLLITTILAGVFPPRPAWADLVPTESVITPSSTADRDRARLRALLDREDVRAQLQTYGVSADEAAARVEALTDREVELIANRLDQVPAGAAVGALVFFLVLGVAVVVAAVVGIVGLIVNAIVNAAKQRPS
ncbi:MAG: PA2779 family protein [Candidatus Rokuibacteriota bacterium]